MFTHLQEPENVEGKLEGNAANSSENSAAVFACTWAAILTCTSQLILLPEPAADLLNDLIEFVFHFGQAGEQSVAQPVSQIALAGTSLATCLIGHCHLQGNLKI